MDAEYDDFFAGQPKVDFECVPGDIRERSGPGEVNVFGGGKKKEERRGLLERERDVRSCCRAFGGDEGMGRVEEDERL